MQLRKDKKNKQTETRKTSVKYNLKRLSTASLRVSWVSPGRWGEAIFGDDVTTKGTPGLKLTRKEVDREEKENIVKMNKTEPNKVPERKKHEKDEILM